ncbi:MULTISPECIES: P-II family nitrogen regulator [Azohydromonas]|jgi:nitrogen regulatory protein P-II 1|uniref:P-II family nitrogen regulator n=1 Tax=Azohydromonas lata TaxID=45677 RepID=A0ABU5I9A9_9BURK|nr:MULTISPECIES: P-II family nitrogen regulator [Azohydromonas]MDZ5455684.1 P-II family nitrogen regulator [Azohydromonas lata]
MKEIKAYVHAHRIGEVIAALKASAAWGAADGGQHNLTVYVVKGSLVPIDEREKHYSIEIGDEVVNEYKLELLCEEPHVDELVAIIRQVGRTGQPRAGWVYVTDVQQALPIG